MGDTEKRQEDIDRRSEEIIEETMKEIFDDLNQSDDFEEFVEEDDSHYDSRENTEDEEEIHEEDSQDEEKHEDFSEDSDDGDLSSDDSDAKTEESVEEEDNFEEEEFEEELEEEELEEEEDDFEEEEDDFEEEELEEEEDDFEEEFEEEEEPDEEKKAKKKGFKKTAAIIAGSIIGVLAVVYIGFAVFFSSHFMFFTEINGTDFSLKSVSQVEAYMKKQVSNYVLTLDESDGGKETINGTDVDLEYVSGNEIKKLVKKQNNFLWITSLWNHPKIESEIGVKYNEDKLNKLTDGLDCMAAENQTASVDAHPEFQNTEFVIIPEVVGTQIDTEKFKKAVAEAIQGFKPDLDMTKEGAYIAPRFVSDSPEVIAAKDAMNKYLGANVTYDFNPYTEVVDASVISQWVKADQDMNVTFDEGAVRAYIQTLADKYDTKGKPRTFTTATGNQVNVEGGSYGWRIDQEAEYNALTANIQNAETVTREPNYSSRAASHEGNDVGGTYAEVDLTNQNMYFVQNGQVVLQTAVVTGNPNKGNGTPAGVFTLAYKARDQVLRGTKKPDGTYEYETPVSYWMPFNGGIGFHDANWQPTFGGGRYLTNGSHGCVNMPPALAAQLYDLISAGTPVVVHY